MKKSKNKIENFKFLDQKFWSDFSHRIWEKKPLMLKKVKSPLLQIGEDEIFNLLLVYSDRCRQINNSAGFKFYIDGLSVGAEDVLQVLPIKQDKNLLGYHKRMNELFSDYCLVCDELLKINSDKQKLLNEFTSELYKNVGFPNRFSEMGLYLGNYRKTPFGVHVDNCGVFSFPVVGVKKFRLWTSAFVKNNPELDRAFDYQKYKKKSQIISIRPGDMSYWPSSAWHIAESDGSFSATWSLGVWVDKTHQQIVSENLNTLLNKKLNQYGQTKTTSFKTLHTRTGEVKELPQDYLRSLQILKKITTKELKETFLKSWMTHISSQGFKNIPQTNKKISLHSKIQLMHPQAKILWQKAASKKLVVYVCFGGVLLEVKKASNLLRLIKDVNKGLSCRVGDYLSGATQKQDLLNLQKIINTGVFI